MTPCLAFSFYVLLPWFLTALCYERSWLASICAWAGLIVQGIINFVIPVYIYILSIDVPSVTIHALPRTWSKNARKLIAQVILLFLTAMIVISIGIHLLDGSVPAG